MKKLIAPIISALVSAAILVVAMPLGLSAFVTGQIVLSIITSALLLISVAWRGCSIAAICISAPAFLIELWLMVARNYITLSGATLASPASPIMWTVLIMHFVIVGCSIAQCSMLYMPSTNR